MDAVNPFTILIMRCFRKPKIIHMIDPTKSRYRHLSLKSEKIYHRFNQGIHKNDLHTLKVDTPTPNISNHGSYAAELFKPEWKAKRNEILKRDAHRCIICKRQEALQVHHRQYHFIVRENQFQLPWNYSNHLLITLCETCHKRGHSKYKVPIINI